MQHVSLYDGALDHDPASNGSYFFDPIANSSHDALSKSSVALEASGNIRTFNTIKETFNRVCGDVVFDERLARRMIEFQISFTSKNEDHIAFFGGVLTGVHIVRFTTTDMNRFFSDVLQINELELEDELHQLKAIVADRKVSGDVFNHTCLWCVHKFLNSNLKPAEARRAAQASALILNYRYLTSLLSWYFRFPANIEDAQAAYSRLTKKSAIKQYGSWNALLDARVADLLPPDGLHGKTTQEYSDDFAIIYALNDSQGRIRSMMKHLMGELIAAKHAGTKVRSTSSSIEMDGESFLRDTSRGISGYTNYIFNVLPDEHTFIKEEIIGIITEALHTTPPQALHATLKWLCTNFKTNKGKEIDPFIEMVMLHSFAYLGDNRNVMRETTDIGKFIMRLKGVYMSPRSSNEHLMKMRDMSERFVKNAIPTRNPAIISSVKTSLMLYIVVRAFTMNYYAR